MWRARVWHARVWHARVRPGWAVDGDGAVYRIPPGPGGQVVYCNVEGVSWLSADTVVVVSDRAKRDGQDAPCRAKDQSIHVFFSIPAG